MQVDMWKRMQRALCEKNFQMFLQKKHLQIHFSVSRVMQSEAKMKRSEGRINEQLWRTLIYLVVSKGSIMALEDEYRFSSLNLGLNFWNVV